MKETKKSEEVASTELAGKKKIHAEHQKNVMTLDRQIRSKSKGDDQSTSIKNQEEIKLYKERSSKNQQQLKKLEEELKKSDKTKQELKGSIASTEQGLRDLEAQATAVSAQSISLQEADIAEYSKRLGRKKKEKENQS